MSTETKLKPATFRHIEAELYAHKYNKRQIKLLREEIMNSSGNQENIGGRNSARTISRTTEEIATRLTTDKRLRNLEEITDAIDATYEELPDSHRKVIEIKYWNNNRYTWDMVAHMCNMHRHTARRYRNEAIQMIANKIGWK